MDTLLSDCPRHFSSAFVPNGNNQGYRIGRRRELTRNPGWMGPFRGVVG